jgi:hypothetical protein
MKIDFHEKSDALRIAFFKKNVCVEKHTFIFIFPVVKKKKYIVFFKSRENIHGKPSFLRMEKDFLKILFTKGAKSRII